MRSIDAGMSNGAASVRVAVITTGASVALLAARCDASCANAAAGSSAARAAARRSARQEVGIVGSFGTVVR